MMKNKILEQLQKYEMKFSWIMLYFYDQVILGKYENEQLVFSTNDYDESLCYEIHLFNKDKEIRCGKDFDFKLIEDPESSEYYLEEKFYILGNKGEINNGFTTLTQYGRKVTLPLEIEVKNASHNARLVVHHLFDEEDGHLKGYRLVDITGGR